VGIVAFEAGIGCELSAHFGHVFANVDLGKPGWASGELAMTEFAKFSRAAHRHVGNLFALLQIRVRDDRTVAELAP